MTNKELQLELQKYPDNYTVEVIDSNESNGRNTRNGWISTNDTFESTMHVPIHVYPTLIKDLNYIRIITDMNRNTTQEYV